MKLLAVLSSGRGENVARLAEILNRGQRMRVVLGIYDRENAPVAEELGRLGVETVHIEREDWRSSPERILDLLKERKIEVLVLDDFHIILPKEVVDAYSGNILDVEFKDDAVKAVVIRSEGERETVVEECVAPREGEPEEDFALRLREKTAEVYLRGTGSFSRRAQKSMDGEWAEVLKIPYDEEQARHTPPPVPDDIIPEIPEEALGRKTMDFRPLISETPVGAMKTEHRPEEPMPKTFLVWAVLMTVVCCTLPGIVAIVFSSLVSSRYYSGDIEGAKRASRNAEIWIIVSFCLGVLSATLYFPMMILF